jgi:type I restriction enzyme S subunit
MSKLDELIQELCPDGVEFRKLGEISQYCKERIDASTVDKTCYVGVENLLQNKQGKTLSSAVPTTGQVIAFSFGDILIGNIRPYLKKIWLADCNGGTNGDVLAIHITDSGMLPEFLYYVLSSDSFFHYDMQYAKGSKMPRGSKEAVLQYITPVPPLPVQREIVRILDNFTELTEGLNRELTVELTARKQQYAYYRDKLLSTNNSSVPVVELRDIVKKSCSGATPAKGNAEYYENGTIPWIRTQDVRFNEITEVNSYITEKAVSETATKWIPENCVIVAISGATAGRCAINKIKATTNQHCLNLIIDDSMALYRYVFHCLCSKYEELISRKQGARGDLNSSLILSLPIPIPSLEVQKRLVEVLDNFDAICTNLSSGLPAEIEARQKQYEYYRDKLLTFTPAD